MPVPMITDKFTAEEYFGIEKKNPRGLSASKLKRLKNPYRNKWVKDKTVEDPSDAILLGSLVDVLWMTPDEFGKQFVVKPEDAPKRPTPAQLNAKKPSDNTKKAILYWKAFDQKAKGKHIVKAELVEHAKELVKLLDSHPDSQHIKRISQKQVTVTSGYQQNPNGPLYHRKALIDLLPDKEDPTYGMSLVDLKVLSITDEDGLSRHINNLDYHVRAAHYLDTYNEAVESLEEHSDLRYQYMLLVIDSESGEIQVWCLDPSDISIGRQQVEFRLERYEEFLAAGEPRISMPRGIRFIERPRWARIQDQRDGCIVDYTE